jgi:hypothetical protein
MRVMKTECYLTGGIRLWTFLPAVSEKAKYCNSITKSHCVSFLRKRIYHYDTDADCGFRRARFDFSRASSDMKRWLYLDAWVNV